MITLLLLLACADEPAEAPPPDNTSAEAPPPDEASAGAAGDDEAAGAGDRAARERDAGAVSGDRASSAPITIEQPRPGDLLGAEATLSGRASVYEGRLTVELRQGEELLFSEDVSAGVAAPDVGQWQVTARLPEGARGAATVRAYTRSARDGSPEDVVEVAVTLGRAPARRP